MKYALFTSLILTCLNAWSQECSIRPEIKRLVHNIQRRNVYEVTYNYHYTPKQIAFADKLGNLATDSELVALTNHRNGVVRVYAFEKLDDRKYEGLYPIILNHLEDDETIRWLNYGDGEYLNGGKGKSSVDEHFISCSNLKRDEREKLDSILIYSKNEYGYVNSLLEYEELDKKYYLRVREFAEKDIYSGATTALARFKQPQDTIIIADNIMKSPNYRMEVIEIFPHPSFKKILNEYRDKNSKPLWFYNAVAAYRDSYAHDYLLECLQDSASNDYYQKEKSEEIFKGIEKYRCPAFNDLLFQLYRTDFLITDSLFKYLKSAYPKQTLEFTIHALEHSDKLDDVPWVVGDMLDFLIQQDSAKAHRIINDNIRNAYVLVFKPFAEHAKAFNDSEIINSLFARLATSDNAYVYMPVVEAILFYNHDELNKKLLETIRGNTLINDWGLERVVKMLEEHNLHL